MCVFVKSDVLCGRLHCQDLPDELVNFQAINYERGQWSYTDGVLCRFAVLVPFYSGPDRPDPGLIPDGASCGTDKVSVSF